MNQAKAECKSCFLRFFPLRIFAFARIRKKKRMKQLQSMNGKARECKRYNPKFDASVVVNFLSQAIFAFLGVW